MASPLTQGAGKGHKIRVNGNPGFFEPGDPVFLLSFRWQGGGGQDSLLQLAAVSSGGRFGVSWAGLALITGSGRLPISSAHWEPKLGAWLGGRKEAGAWGRGCAGACRSFPALPRAHGPRGCGAASASMLPHNEGGELRGAPYFSGLSLVCGCLYLP